MRGHFDQREIVELTATVGGYNPVSRFLEALVVDPESSHVRRVTWRLALRRLHRIARS